MSNFTFIKNYVPFNRQGATMETEVNPYLERIQAVWFQLTPWQQFKLYVKAMYWATLGKAKVRLLTIWQFVLKSM
jgi:hypothetical protein